MRARYLGAVGTSGIVAALGVLMLAPLSGQQASAPKPASASTASRPAYKVPRLANGQPDFTGVWANNNITPLQRPKELGTRQYLTDAELNRLKSRAEELFAGDGDAAFGDEIFAAALSDRTKYVADSFDKDTGNYNSYWLVGRDFSNRTSLIIDPPDGRLPPLTATAEKRNADRAAARKLRGFADSHQDRPLSERCITFGQPDLFAGYNSYFQISQSPTWVAIHTERIHDTRLVALDGRPHVSSGVRLMNGDSRGRWDGDTLVIDTTNYAPGSGSQGASEGLHLIERFTRVSADTLEYQVTLEDPSVWTRPWTLMIPLKHTTDKIYEYACHEGNTGLFGVLAGARAQDRGGAPAASAK